MVQNICLGGGYIFVDFFFILQGFYLLRNTTDDVDSNKWLNFVKNNIGKFFPCVLCMAVLLFALQVVNDHSVRNIEKLIVQGFFQISFTAQMMPFMFLGAGGILWFLSARFFAGLIALLVKVQFKDKAIPIAFVLSVILYNNIIITHGNLDIWHDFAFGNSVFAGCQRALAGVLFGGVISAISQIVNAINFRKWVILAGRILTLITVLSVIVYTIFVSHTRYDSCAIVAFGILLILVNRKENQICSKITDEIDMFCIPMYIFQVCSIMIISHFVKAPCWQGAILTLLIDTALSIIWNKFENKIRLMQRCFIKIE